MCQKQQKFDASHKPGGIFRFLVGHGTFWPERGMMSSSPAECNYWGCPQKVGPLKDNNGPSAGRKEFRRRVPTPPTPCGEEITFCREPPQKPQKNEGESPGKPQIFLKIYQLLEEAAGGR